MEVKEIHITPPEGYEIDKVNSTFECIKFKPKCLNYEDVAAALFNDKTVYYIGIKGQIMTYFCHNYGLFKTPTKGTSKKQLEKLLAINKLLNVSRFLNGSWKPDWKDEKEQKWIVSIRNGGVGVSGFYLWTNSVIAYFKTEELARQAIDILGEDTIRLALSTDW